jgi:tellurite resistance protein TerC
MQQSAHIFPFADFWPVYLLFSCGVALVLWASLRAFSRTAHEVSIREATISALSWFGLALIFNVILYFFTWWHLEHSPATVAALGATADALARQTALEFLSGYLLEKSLAVDNLFVFIVIFRFFSVAPQYQQRVLFYGLFGAIALRAIFIAMGAVVMEIPWVVIFFGIFLIYQGIGVLRGREPEIHPENNTILRILKRFIPISNSMDGQRFFTKIDGRWLATPLFVTLIFVEITDIMFAFDSVPAIFGLTREPMVVFTSNIFAVIDLRALYFLLAAFISRFHYLSYGLSFVLIFIGLKMALFDEVLHMKIPTEVSLLIVLTLIIGSVVLSLVKPPSKKEVSQPGN